MHFQKITLAIITIVFSLIANTFLPQYDQGAEAERLIQSYIESRNLSIETDTDEYSALMKGILLGEHPELTGQKSSMVTNDLTRNQILSYAAAHMDGLGFQADNISIIHSVEPSLEELVVSHND